MGYESVEPLYQRYRSEFPITRNLIYLNHAGVAPLCRRAATAMQELTSDALEFGSYHYDRWLAVYEGLRAAAARLINASPEEIALTKNTSEGVATVALGIDWRPGDRVVAFKEEFPANYYPWKRLENQGVEVDWLSVSDPLDKVAETCRGARLLAISFVQFLSGFRADVTSLGEICEEHDCLFFVDAIQGLGAFPLDVKKSKIHALAADGHKWMLGPEGCAILYVQRDLQDSIEPVEFGWTNVAGYNDYASRDMALRQDAGRYECGTLNTVGCYGLRASIEFLLEVGVENIGQLVQARADEVAEGALRKGYELMGRRTPESGAGIVSFRKPGMDSRLVVRALKDRKIAAAPRAGWVRISPHFYISPEDIEQVILALP